jgi:REP element-mobilizing transposase RayT
MERAGAWHQVTARGSERRAIFRDERARARFCQWPGETARVFRWRWHACVLMDSHYHLLAETPEPNLGRAMQWLNASYSVWFNRRHQRAGHLFQGRFKSIVVGAMAVSVAARRLARRVSKEPELSRALNQGRQKLQMFYV